MAFKLNGKNYSCPVELALNVIHGKWKIFIIYFLNKRIHRFGELRKAIPGITQKMLTNHLQELEADGLITRTVYAEVPPKVEYDLSDAGRALQPILCQLCDFGETLYHNATGESTGFPCDMSISPYD